MVSQQQIQTCEAILEKYGGSLAGKTILITGIAPDSIAGELTFQLSAAKPALLVVSARSEARVEPVVARIKQQNPDVATRFLKMDLSDQRDVRRAAASLSDLPKIDHFLAIAGIMWPPYSKTVDGIESQFAVNYISNFLLVQLLLPQIEAAGRGSAIVIMASSAVRTGVINFENINYTEETYQPMVSYAQSNAARVMFVKKLAKQLMPKGIRTYSVDPGGVRSGLQRHCTPEITAWIEEVTSSNGGTMKDADGNEWQAPPWTSASEGAATIITGMVDSTIESFNGSFLHNNAVADEELHSHIIDEANWDKLWELSESLIGK